MDLKVEVKKERGKSYETQRITAGSAYMSICPHSDKPAALANTAFPVKEGSHMKRRGYRRQCTSTHSDKPAALANPVKEGSHMKRREIETPIGHMHKGYTR